MALTPMTEPHHIELSDAEVIVLDAVLNQLTSRQEFEHLVADEADRQALHNLVCLLERIDPAVLAPDYDARLSSARRQLLGET
jgi:hypothetical protein